MCDVFLRCLSIFMNVVSLVLSILAIRNSIEAEKDLAAIYDDMAIYGKHMEHGSDR